MFSPFNIIEYFYYLFNQSLNIIEYFYYLFNQIQGLFLCNKYINIINSNNILLVHSNIHYTGHSMEE